MNNYKKQTLLPTLLASTIMACGMASAEGSGGLTYGGERETLMNLPIPPSEQNFQTVTAEPWYKVSDEGIQLEGPAFDEEGNLFLSKFLMGEFLSLRQTWC